MRRLFAGLVLLGVSSCTTTPAPRSATPSMVVFFAEKSAALEPAAADIIAHAASLAKASPDAPVVVRGWTDSGGSPQADILLSQQRAQRVADALVADGVPVSRISRQGRGQTHDDPGVESRRVEIRVGNQ